MASRLTSLILLTVLLLSCAKNASPTIDGLFADPDSVYPGDTVYLTCGASDVYGDPITFIWSYHENNIGGPIWIAPKRIGQHFILVTVTDGIYRVTDSIGVTVLDTMGTFTDARDSHQYKWIKIGKQVWMAENLAWLPEVYPGKVGSKDTALYYVYDYEGYDIQLAKQTENYSKYGVLYNWQAARGGEENISTVHSGVRGVCPDGWHLPSYEEFRLLLLSSSDIRADFLSESDWMGEENGENIKGLSVYPSGYRGFILPTLFFGGQNVMALFWTTTREVINDYPGDVVRVVRFTAVPLVGGHEPWAGDHEGLSVRCVKD